MNHTNIDIQAMLVWLIVPFYDLCGFRSVAVNSVYKCSAVAEMGDSLATVDMG